MSQDRDERLATLEARVGVLESKSKAPLVLTTSSLLNLMIGLAYAFAEACGHEGSRRR